jgi:predicted ATP-dependent serine protease
MSFCPNCRYEYKEGIGECPDCGARLVDRLEDKSTGTEEEECAETKEFAPLMDFASRAEAQMLQEALENEGIPSIIKEDHTYLNLKTAGGISQLAGGGVYVWVPKQRLKKSKEIADQMLDHI